MIKKAFLALMLVGTSLGAWQWWEGRLPYFRVLEAQAVHYLRDSEDAPRTLRAMRQLGSRQDLKDELAGLLKHPNDTVRALAAEYYRFETEPLKPLLEDLSPLVRFEAAASLAALGNAEGRTLLLTMLYPVIVYSPYGGKMQPSKITKTMVKVGETVATIDGKPLPAPVPGLLRSYYDKPGAVLQTGERVAEIEPSEPLRRAALVGLARVGTVTEAEEVMRLSKFFETPNLSQQATLTLQEIQARRPKIQKEIP
jgi:hypothetical protein